MQVPLHCVPFPTQTHPVGCQGYHSDDLDAGGGDNVSLSRHVNSRESGASLHGA